MAKADTDLAKRFRVEPGEKVKLSKFDPDDTAGIPDKEHSLDSLRRNLKRLFNLQMVLSAGAEYALLVVLQGLDSAGKDGTIRHVMTGLNPQACRVSSFKVPTEEELRHDFLWRIHTKVPERGEIGIFNRSHYEDVLVARVHKLVPKDVWSDRYDQINDFEKMLSKNRVVILKFFLHISKEEQARRLKQRVEDPRKNWKLSPSDFPERKYWDEYTDAYEDALTTCSTRRAPWYVIPSDKKWFRNLAVSQIMIDTLTDLKLKYPPAKFDIKQLHEAVEAAGAK